MYVVTLIIKEKNASGDISIYGRKTTTKKEKDILPCKNGSSSLSCFFSFACARTNKQQKQRKTGKKNGVK